MVRWVRCGAVRCIEWRGCVGWAGLGWAGLGWVRLGWDGHSMARRGGPIWFGSDREWKGMAVGWDERDGMQRDWVGWGMRGGLHTVRIVNAVGCRTRSRLGYLVDVKPLIVLWHSIQPPAHPAGTLSEGAARGSQGSSRFGSGGRTCASRDRRRAGVLGARGGCGRKTASAAGADEHARVSLGGVALDGGWMSEAPGSAG